MRIDVHAATSAIPCTWHAQRPASTGAHDLSVGIGDCGKPPECFDDFLIENLAKIGVVETNFARRFVIFEGHDLIGLLAPRQDPRSEPPEQPTSVVHSRSGFVGHDLHGRSLGCNTPATFPFPDESSHFDLKSSGPLAPWSRRGPASHKDVGRVVAAAERSGLAAALLASGPSSASRDRACHRTHYDDVPLTVGRARNSSTP